MLIIHPHIYSSLKHCFESTLNMPRSRLQRWEGRIQIQKFTWSLLKIILYSSGGGKTFTQTIQGVPKWEFSKLSWPRACFGTRQVEMEGEGLSGRETIMRNSQRTGINVVQLGLAELIVKDWTVLGRCLVFIGESMGSLGKFLIRKVVHRKDAVTSAVRRMRGLWRLVTDPH